VNSSASKEPGHGGHTNCFNLAFLLQSPIFTVEIYFVLLVCSWISFLKHFLFHNFLQLHIYSWPWPGILFCITGLQIVKCGRVKKNKIALRYFPSAIRKAYSASRPKIERLKMV
jgi:hypothetical protein